MTCSLWTFFSDWLQISYRFVSLSDEGRKNCAIGTSQILNFLTMVLSHFFLYASLYDILINELQRMTNFYDCSIILQDMHKK